MSIDDYDDILLFDDKKDNDTKKVSCFISLKNYITTKFKNIFK